MKAAARVCLIVAGLALIHPAALASTEQAYTVAETTLGAEQAYTVAETTLGALDVDSYEYSNATREEAAPTQAPLPSDVIVGSAPLPNDTVDPDLEATNTDYVDSANDNKEDEDALNKETAAALAKDTLEAGGAPPDANEAQAPARGTHRLREVFDQLQEEDIQGEAPLNYTLLVETCSKLVDLEWCTRLQRTIEKEEYAHGVLMLLLHILVHSPAAVAILGLFNVVVTFVTNGVVLFICVFVGPIKRKLLGCLIREYNRKTYKSGNENIELQSVAR